MIKEESRFSESLLFEGMVSFRAVVAAMENPSYQRRITEVFYDASREKNLRGHLSYIRAMSKLHGFPVTAVPPDIIAEMSVGASHGGILFRATERSLPLFDEKEIGENEFIVFLDGIEDPYNFGYALRSLYASGVDRILLPKRNWLSAAGVVCRASAGASELFPVSVCEPESAAQVLKYKGYKLVCAELENSVSCVKADLRRPLCLVVGGEKRGSSSSLKKLCDAFVRIDYGRDFPAALSAASAAAILSFEVLRQNAPEQNAPEQNAPEQNGENR